MKLIILVQTSDFIVFIPKSKLLEPKNPHNTNTNYLSKSEISQIMDSSKSNIRFSSYSPNPCPK